MEERVKELYEGGQGIKSIARELNLSPSFVRRTLLRQKVYLGAARAREARETIEQSIFVSTTVAKNLTSLTWRGGRPGVWV